MLLKQKSVYFAFMMRHLLRCALPEILYLPSFCVNNACSQWNVILTYFLNTFQFYIFLDFTTYADTQTDTSRTSF